jgi:hypothetical protein
MNNAQRVTAQFRKHIGIPVIGLHTTVSLALAAAIWYAPVAIPAGLN